MKEHYLYKYVYNDEIIYIGKTNSNLRQRIHSHANEEKFQPYINEAQIYIMELANCTEVNGLELLLINKYRPILNYADKHDKTTNIYIEEPAWNTYQSYLDNCDEVINTKQIARCVSTINKLYHQLLSLEEDRFIINPMLRGKEEKLIDHKIEKTKEAIKKWNNKYKYYKSNFSGTEL